MRAVLVMAMVGCGGGAPAAHLPAVQLEAGAQRIPVEGTEVAYEVRGSGPVCIAHPGGPGLDAAYIRIRALEERFTMVYIDPLGTGASGKLPAGEQYSIPRDVRVIEAVRVKLGLDRVCLVGHSYGGFVVQQYAVDHPAQVAGLFLYSTSPATGPDFEKQIGEHVAWFKDQPFFADAMKGFAEEPTAKTQAEIDSIGARIWPMYFADYSGHAAEYKSVIALLKIDADVYKRRPEGKNNRFDVRARLAIVHTTPTVIVAGDKDFICGVTTSTWIAQRIGGSKLIVIPHAGHFAHVEQPAAFGDAVETFATLLR